MTVESVKLISDLDELNPGAGDSISEGDDHIRNIKKAILGTFPNITEKVTATADDLNRMSGFAQAGNGVFASCKFNSVDVKYGQNVASVTVVNNGQYQVNFTKPTDGFDNHYAVQVTPIATNGRAVIACVNDQDTDHVGFAVKEETADSTWGVPVGPIGFYMTMIDMIQTEANANT